MVAIAVDNRKGFSSMSHQLMGVREYARHREEKGLPGVSHQAVLKAIKSGRISAIKTGEKGQPKIDPVVADIQWNANTDPTQSARANAGRDVSAIDCGAKATGEKGEGSRFWEAKTSREEVELARAKLALEKDAGRLVDKDGVRRAGHEAGRLLRDMVLAVPPRLAAELAVMTDARQIEVRMTDELRKMLANLARLASSGFSDSPEQAR